jgi:hypothetical protein
VSSSTISVTAARSTLTRARRLYRQELSAATRHNPGVSAHRLREIALAAAFPRLVRLLESAGGVSGTLDDNDRKAGA